MTSHGQTLLGELIRTTINAKQVDENYRPDWLNGMELDFWVPEWNLAFEFQGDQHFSPVYGLQHMVAQQVRDKLKRKLCEARGIALLSFEATCLEPFKMRCKLSYHLARLHPKMKKGERRRLINKILIPKHANKRERKIALKRKLAYCRTLKESFHSPTAHKKGSQLRKAAFEDNFRGINWRELYTLRKQAQDHYNPPPPPLPRYGMGMAKASRYATSRPPWVFPPSE